MDLLETQQMVSLKSALSKLVHAKMLRPLKTSSNAFDLNSNAEKIKHETYEMST